jgi:L-alanine-DL-glutamate epimerase-like enolase superfamily enzyme
MSIREFQLRSLKLAEPFRIAHGSSTERTVFRIFEGGSVGEAPFVPYYEGSPEDVCRWMHIQGADFLRGGQLSEEAPTVVKLAADVLEQDLKGKASGVGVWQLLSQPSPCFVTAGRSLGIPSDLTEFSEKVREASRQFRQLKLKLGSGDSLFDEEVVAKAREAAPHAILFADVNGGWSVAEAVAMLPKLRRYRMAFVEQPVHHSGGVESWEALHAALPSLPLPLYADESVQGAEDLRELQGLIQGVNVKLLKTGTFHGALQLISAARTAGIKTLLGCMIESSIGVTAAAHLAGACDWIDLDGHLYLEEDDFIGVAYDPTGRLVLPQAPGLGVQRRTLATFS